MRELITSIVHRKSVLYRFTYLGCVSLLAATAWGLYLVRPYLKLPVGLVSDTKKQILVEVPFQKLKEKITQEERARLKEEMQKNGKELQLNISLSQLPNTVEQKLRTKLVENFYKGTPVYRLSDRLHLAGYIAEQPKMEEQRVLYCLQMLEDKGIQVQDSPGETHLDFALCISSPSVMATLRQLFYQKEELIKEKAKELSQNLNTGLGELCKQLNSECQETATLPITISKDKLREVLLQSLVESVNWNKVLQDMGSHQKTEELERLFKDNLSVASLVSASLKGLVTRLKPLEGGLGDIERQLKKILKDNQEQILSDVWKISEQGMQSAQLEIERAWLLLGKKDFSDLDGFIAQLKSRQDKVSEYLYQKLLADLHAQLRQEQPQVKELPVKLDGLSTDRILDMLNRILGSPFFYQEAGDGTPKIADVLQQTELSEETKKMAELGQAMRWRGNSLLRCQRLVLQDIYPSHIKKLEFLARISCLFSLADNPVLRQYIVSQVPPDEQEVAWRKFQKILYNPPSNLVQPLLKMQEDVKTFASTWVEAILLNKDKDGPNPLLLLALKESFAGQRPLVICYLSTDAIDKRKNDNQRFIGAYKE
jgi:hypothetical protein